MSNTERHKTNNPFMKIKNHHFLLKKLSAKHPLLTFITELIDHEK